MTKDEINKYLSKRIWLYVGFGYLVGLVSGLGAFVMFR